MIVEKSSQDLCVTVQLLKHTVDKNNFRDKFRIRRLFAVVCTIVKQFVAASGHL